VQLTRFANTRRTSAVAARSHPRGERVRVVLEATGLYALDLALLLSAQNRCS